MDTDGLVQILGASAVTAVLGAIVQAIVNRRKLSAEATNIITQAAGGLVANLQADNGRLRTENAQGVARESRARSAVRTRDELFRKRLEAHMAWDLVVVKKLREAGIHLPNPPKLELPEIDYDDEDDFIG